MIFVITMMYEIKEDNWRACIFYLPDLLGWPDLARRVNSHHVRGCLFAIWTWQEKYFMRILALSWKFIYVSINISWAQVSNFKKIWAFVAGIFAKQYWLSENFQIQCIFLTFTSKVLKDEYLLNVFFWKLKVKNSMYVVNGKTVLLLLN